MNTDGVFVFILYKQGGMNYKNSRIPSGNIINWTSDIRLDFLVKTNTNISYYNVKS